MFGKHSDLGYVKLLEGVSVKTLCHGDLTSMTEFKMENGAKIPPHSHPNEQTGYLISGRLLMHSGGTSREVIAGGSWSFQANAVHAVDVLEDSLAVEVFAPARVDYMKFIRSEDYDC